MQPFYWLETLMTPLLEDVFCLFKQVAEYIFIVLLGLFAFEASEFFEQAFLFWRQIGRSDHFNDDVLVAKGGLCEANGQFIEDIVARALEVWVRLYRENDVQVARRTTAGAYLSFAGNTHIDTIVYACGNIDDDAAIVAYSPLTTTFLTGCGNDATLATAAFAHCYIDELPKDGLLHAANLAGALAGGTTSCRCAGLCATAPAARAGFPAR